MKNKKNILPHLLSIASKLPQATQTSTESDLVLGSWIKATNVCDEYMKANNLETIHDDVHYPFPQMVKIPVNHFNRLKSAYKSQGLAGVKQYVEKVKKLYNELKLKS